MNDGTRDLWESWKNSPYPSTKVSRYFSAYGELFSHLRGSDCTFVETGILGGGSLFMWRQWLGPKARIIGVDLNPAALKWRDHGFEIYIGDQGSPDFWARTWSEIGAFDVLLDDGGHQSFQQIVTLEAALRHAQKKSIVAIEDTHTSYMRDFSSHGQHHFMNYAKECAEVLTVRGYPMYPTRMRSVQNIEAEQMLQNVKSVQFFDSLVAFKIDPGSLDGPSSVLYNHKGETPTDFRYEGKSSAEVTWPNPFVMEKVVINGGPAQ